MSDPLGPWRCKHRELVFACRVLRDRFGDGAVDDVARRHMENVREAFREKARETGRTDLEAVAEMLTAPSETHDVEVLHRDARRLEVRITRCAHAEFFRAWGAADVGRKFMCGGDEAMIAGLNPKITLERPELLMEGGRCCHFIYRLET